MRLIDLDTLKRNLCGDCVMNFPKECRQIGCTEVDKQDILEALRIPIIDAVPVIRCKDCKWNTATEWVHCAMLGGMFGRTTDNYCSRAERKEE